MKFEFSHRQVVALAIAAGLASGASVASAAERSLLNVSYDPTRELYQAFNAEFVKHWKETTGETVQINCRPRFCRQREDRARWRGRIPNPCA